jgi:hypothetical protein
MVCSDPLTVRAAHLIAALLRQADAGWRRGAPQRQPFGRALELTARVTIELPDPVLLIFARATDR